MSLLTSGDDCEYELNKVEEVEEDYEGEGAYGGEENNVPAIEVVDTWRRERERVSSTIDCREYILLHTIYGSTV